MLFTENSPNAFNRFMYHQLTHADWEGLTFWDLVQPFFMFITGVAMAFSIPKKWQKGQSWNKTFKDVIVRSLILFFLGWLIGSGETSSNFTNVLAQLSVAYLLTFLFMRFSIEWQVAVSFLLIIISQLLYQFWSVPGFNQPYTADHNFGSWFDILLTGQLSSDRWVAFNAIPTTAHTMWGCIAGFILKKNIAPNKKFWLLLIIGLAGVALGFASGMYIPVIKRISTASFTVLSGGWCFVGLAVSFLIIDIFHFKRLGFFFAIVGMNPLLIYMFSHSGGKEMLRGIIAPLTYRLFNWISPNVFHTITILVVSGMLWGICYFFYKRKIFIRI